MTTELVVRQAFVRAPLPSIDDISRVAKAYAMSGYWPDARDVAQAFVKVQFGYEVGLPAYIAMSEVHIIQGKPALGAGALAALVKAHPIYDYRVGDHSDERCLLEFFQDGESVGVSEFTTEHAQQAGLMSNQTYKKYPRNMLFARAMSNGVAWYCPDVTMGRVYTPDEVGGTLEGGSYIIPPEELDGADKESVSSVEYVDYDVAKLTDSELLSELFGDPSQRPYRTPAYFDALRREAERRHLPETSPVESVQLVEEASLATSHEPAGEAEGGAAPPDPGAAPDPNKDSSDERAASRDSGGRASGSGGSGDEGPGLGARTPAPPEQGQFEPPGSLATDLQRKKLNVLYGKLTANDEQLKRQFCEAAGGDGTERWAEVRDRLTKGRASALIDHLEKNVAGQ